MKIGTKLLCYNEYTDEYNTDFVAGEYYTIYNYIPAQTSVQIYNVNNKIWFSLNPKHDNYMFNYFLTETEEKKLIRKLKISKIENSNENR